MPKTNQPTFPNNQSSQSSLQEFEQRYQQWLEREMLRQDNGAFYDY